MVTFTILLRKQASPKHENWGRPFITIHSHERWMTQDNVFSFDEKQVSYDALVARTKSCNPKSKSNPICSRKLSYKVKDDPSLNRFITLQNASEVEGEKANDENQIGPRSALHNSLNASIMLVLQDFGTIGDYKHQREMQMKEYGEFKGQKMPENKQDLGKNGRTPTTDNLEDRMKALLQDDTFTFNMADPKGRIFITNSCLCLRNEITHKSDGSPETTRLHGYKSSSYTDQWSIECCKRHMHNKENSGLIDIIRPMMVIGIGQPASRGILSCYSQTIHGRYFDFVRDNINGIPLGNGTIFFPVFHTSNQTHQVRKELSIELNDLENHFCDWNGAVRYYRENQGHRVHSQYCEEL